MSPMEFLVLSAAQQPYISTTRGNSWSSILAEGDMVAAPSSCCGIIRKLLVYCSAAGRRGAGTRRRPMLRAGYSSNSASMRNA